MDDPQTQELSAAARSLQATLGCGLDFPAGDRGALEAAIAARFRQLLQEAPERIPYHAYRLDVDENAVVAILALADPVAQAQQLSRLVLDRQVRRIRTRRDYQSGQTRNSENADA